MNYPTVQVNSSAKGELHLSNKLFAYPYLSSHKNGWGLNLHGEEININRSHSLLLHTPIGYPIYEGTTIHQFTHLFSKPRFWIEESNIRRTFLSKRVKRISGLKAIPNDLKNDYEEYRIVIRSNTRSKDNRTLISTIAPPYSLIGKSLYVNSPFFHSIDNYNTLRMSYQEIICLVSILNSFVVDYILRSRIDTNLNISHLNEIPIPHLTKDFCGAFPEVHQTFEKIVERSAKLICTTPEFNNLAAEVMLANQTNGITDEVKRAQIRAELDGIIAHLYHLTETEFAHILQTFPIVPEATKIMALNAYRDVERGLI
jgi:hypothetical protein